MNKQSETSSLFFEPAKAGKTLKEVGIDYLKIEEKNITSRWFHSNHDVDLFVWLDEKSQVIKQQVSFCGQIVEWNILDGLKTGLVIEEEMQSSDEPSTKKIDSSEVIRFDTKPQKDAVMLAVEVILNIENIEDLIRNNLLSNFGLRAGQSFKAKPTSRAVESNPTKPFSFANWFKKILKIES